MSDKNPQIVALNKVGQSIWYDNLSRDVLESGELASLIAQGVSGLTSNPTIFQKAISDSDKYDDSLRKELKHTQNDEELCEALMIEDVANAADLLRPVYDETNGLDGYASIEVSPYLARDTEGTLVAARRIWATLGRPNIMIKVPATNEGIPAIQALLRDGINVNVTLIFSSSVYGQVADAYLSGLEQRQADGNPIDHISSVASFFVSRVDAICEKKFDELLGKGKVDADNRAAIVGRVGIANSKIAYALYEELFVTGSRFAALRNAGAAVQRPLWASTGTKNPDFSPVLYVEELAGKDTVNTLPPATLTALLEKASIAPNLHQGLNSARGCIENLAKLGIPFEELLAQLQQDGVKSFADSYTSLLEAIAQKRTRLQG